MGYTKTALIGISWVGSLRFFTKGIGFVRTLILARILTPAQFGLFGIATLILGLLEMLTETGINVVIVQDQDKNSLSAKLNTALTVSICRGFLIGTLIFLAAPLIGNFFHKPESVYLIQLIALVPLIRGFINPAIVNLQKNLLFKQEFGLKATLAILDATVAITVSLIYQTPIGLVFGMLTSAITEMIFSYLFIRPIPKPGFDPIQFHQIIHMGRYITFAGILSYGASKGPEYALGKFYPSQTLGAYQLANNLSCFASNEVNEAINRVTFPLYVKICHDRRRLLTAFIKHTLTTFVLVTPISLLLILFPELIIRLTAGDKWIAAIPYIQGLAVYAMIVNLFTSVQPLFLALKKQSYVTMLSLIQFLAMAITLLPAIHLYQSRGVILAMIFSALAILPLKIILGFRLIAKQP